ncbi:L,D-transpeptidase family protein [Spirosoma taeanense]|uniref:L,D-transpeptidase family protein n=1 Tax=Spirosoma taeanense TaxID=2735870 RepID=A0A6M5YBK5_9BACT|nr:L,D-transpeptidase family protein [Spirosoma taeanense]QJW90643.1 L,D-transpeptidase family protein [Spirosoma taeanense]
MKKQTIWISIAIAVVAGLVLFVFLSRDTVSPGRKSLFKKNDNAEQAARKLQETKLTLHQVCRYADSVGIDTTRYAFDASTSSDELNDKISSLLLEVRYGKKPSRLEYSGLKETIDTSWADKGADKFSRALLTQNSEFTPYQQLVGHYQRLRRRAASSPESADSLRLIRQTLNFYRYINRFEPDKFVLVNIPAGELNVFDRSGKRLLPMKVIAGKKDKRTPCMTTYIKGIVAYPYWNVPKGIAINEMLPRIKRDLAYLYNQNLQVLDSRDQEVDPETIDWESLSETNFPYRIRQASGCENSLGLIKFDLANPMAIYLHDTNGRDLFTVTSDRWRSHGCVRVQKPVELANFVLGKQTFDAGFMNRCLINQKPQPLAVPQPFPVFIAYNVADVDSAGALRIYKDVYALELDK